VKTFLVSLAAGAAAYELAALRNEAEGDTLSEVVWSASDRWPVVAFAAGMVAGHFFWPRVKR
jgi:hypothetical protein